MQKKYLGVLGCVAILASVGLFFGMSAVSAQIITGSTTVEATRQLSSAGVLDSSATATAAQDPRLIVATIIRLFLSLLGTILLVLIVMSGYWYFTARGDDEKITQAKTTLKQALMGMIIITTAYAITQYTIASLSTGLKTGGQDTPPQDVLRFW